MELLAEDTVSSHRPTEEDQVRKRHAIGLTGRRPTAKEIVQLPPDEGRGRGLMWIAVLTLIAIAVVTGYLVYDTVQAETRAEAPPAIGRNLIVRDDFEPPVLDLTTGEATGIWQTSLSDGHYRITIEQPGRMAWTTLGLLDLGSYRLDSSLVFEGEGGDREQRWGFAGLLARYNNAQSFYLLTMDARGFYQIQLQRQGVWETVQPWTRTLDLNAGEAFRLAVEDDGRQLRFYTADRLLYTVDDPRLPGGDVGLLAGTRSRGTVSAAFDWVEVYSIPSQQGFPDLPFR